ncbi:MAG TPA: lysophospholipid acyltransferase family protein [Mycobacteriales bacterium]|nr:lysophospholipid acyltransferase family protein [Mycobacteriales bacterium]
MGLFGEAKLLARGRDWRGRSRTPRSAEPFAPVRAPREFPTAWARTPAAGAVRTAIQRGVLRPLVWSQTSPEVSGLDLIEGVTGPVIFIANHASHLDAPLILGSLPGRFTRRMAVGAAADYFFDARWRAGLTALVFNAFPVERQGSRRLRSLAPRLLDEGWNLLLFPEGTRSQDGWMNQFRLGTAQLCCTRGVPAVPLAVRGSFAAMPRGRNWPRPDRPKVALHYGRPVRPDPDESMRHFNERLCAAASRLWVEEDLGWYGSLRAQARGAVALPTGPAGAGWRRVWESTRPLPDPRPRDVWDRRR